MKVDLGSSILFCFVGPTGGGKTSLCTKLSASDLNLAISISATSRAARSNEKNGEHYLFYSKADFQKLISNDQVFEWEQVHGNFYGTLRSTLETAAQSNQDLLLDIDIKGALNFQKNFPANTVLIFVVPPSLEELICRVNQRSPESPETIANRLTTAQHEFLNFQQNYSNFDYFIVNKNLADSLNTATAIVHAERARLDRHFVAISKTVNDFISSLNQQISDT